MGMKESYRTLFMFRLVVLLILGILLSRYGFSNNFELIAAWGLLSLAFGLLSICYPFKKHLYLSLLYSFGVVAMGSLLYTIHDQNGVVSDIALDKGSIEGTAIIVTNDYPVQRKLSRVDGDLIAINGKPLVRHISIQLSSTGDQLMPTQPRDTIVADIRGSFIKQKEDVIGFDYNQYLLDKGIYLTARTSGKFTIEKVKGYHGIDKIKYQWRSWALDAMKDHLTEDSFGLAASLVLGFRYELDPDVRDQFAATGALHVLAVSGLHVGIIISMLSFLFYWLPRDSVFMFVSLACLFLVILIIYVLITGASAPVIRATLIFLLFYWSRRVERQVSSLNLLAIVAFFMLVYNPLQLFHVSFQLSFVAVSSIIIFYPYIHHRLRVKNKIARFVWSVLSMSLAAQVLVLPMSCFYFYQIPLYFWLSSVIAIALAYVIIPLAFVTLGLLAFGVTANVLWQLLEVLCDLLLGSIRLISQLPLATISEVVIDHIEIFMIYGFLFLLVIFLFTRYKRWLLVIGGYVILSQVFLIAKTVYIKNRATLILDKSIPIVLVGDDAYLISNKRLNSNIAQIRAVKQSFAVREVIEISAEDLMFKIGAHEK